MQSEMPMTASSHPSGSGQGPNFGRFIPQTGQKRGYKNCLQCHHAKIKCVAVPGRRCQACQRRESKCSHAMDISLPAPGETAPHLEERSPGLPQPIRPSLNMDPDPDPDQAMYAPRANLHLGYGATTNVEHFGNRQHEHKPYPALSSAAHGALPRPPFQPWPTFQQPCLHSSTYGMHPAAEVGAMWSPMPMAPQSGFEQYASGASVFEDASRIYRNPFHNLLANDHNHMSHQGGESVLFDAEEEEEGEGKEGKRKGKR
ncbi:hypothetical protein EDD37DRAFT_349852 [Exophiala viscosa]|uniref:uncharacterized protein n=1 Tax=Exophiala viscosa TaxID=2486360 RepID=UPI00219158A2|nr:hypothetical protein EDD37DRAFT_349852 [Exophiala viscosa]